jgi:hypothetical protein
MKQKYDRKVESKLGFLKDVENQMIASGQKFQLPKIDLSTLGNEKDKEYTERSTKHTTARSTRRDFFKSAALSSRAFYMKNTHSESAFGKKYHKPKKHLRFNLAQSFRQETNENQFTQTLIEKFGKIHQVNRLSLNGLKN